MKASTGTRSGSLVILSITDGSYRCRCDCGTEIDVKVNNFRPNDPKRSVRSCGCSRFKQNVKHGFYQDKALYPLFNSWKAMIQRCTNPNHISWKHYGARGITVCDRWLEFKNFLEDMGERPPGMTLERKDNDLGYSRGNCVWATRKVQSNNQRRSRVLPSMDRHEIAAVFDGALGFGS